MHIDTHDVTPYPIPQQQQRMRKGHPLRSYHFGTFSPLKPFAKPTRKG
jgi:hypothetical protein